MKYKLNVQRDVDVDGHTEDEMSYILNLPYGFRFFDDDVHTRGYDTMHELRIAAKSDVIICTCADCKAHA
jgi:hypothetical protein